MRHYHPAPMNRTPSTKNQLLRALLGGVAWLAFWYLLVKFVN